MKGVQKRKISQKSLTDRWGLPDKTGQGAGIKKLGIRTTKVEGSKQVIVSAANYLKSNGRSNRVKKDKNLFCNYGYDDDAMYTKYFGQGRSKRGRS